MTDAEIVVSEDLYKDLRRIAKARRLDRALLRDIGFDPEEYTRFAIETGLVPSDADLDLIREAVGGAGRPLSEAGSDWRGVGQILLRGLAVAATVGLGLVALLRRRASPAEAEAVASVSEPAGTDV
jgi:hypothetical protein